MRSLFVVLTLGLFLTACSETDTDKISDAQSCLDRATADNVNDCVGKVEGIETRGANMIRCTAKFVEQRYTEGNRVFIALQNLDNGGGGNQSTAVMAALAFSKHAPDWNTDVALAQEAVTLCQKAQASALVNIATFASISTVASQFAGLATNPDGSVNSGALQGALATIAAGGPGAAAAQTVIGTAAIAAFDENCSGESNNAPGEFCNQFADAVAQHGGNAQSIGQFLAQCYSAPGTAGCEHF